MSHDVYHLLGRTGLRVSRLSLGAMTFGTEWGWGVDEQGCREILAKYLEGGGNFVDTADVYTQGTSERILGKLIAERKARHKIVLATKFTHNLDRGNPNAGGNGRKNILRAVDASLERLATDFIDLYILHSWDGFTPAAEVLRTLDDLVTAGKIRHYGLSDVPAWYASEMHTLAEARGLEPVSSVQLEYSLLERHIELEFVPLARTKNIAITAWSPLASGILSGKYPSRAAVANAQGRLAVMQQSTNKDIAPLTDDDEQPAFGIARLTERSFNIIETLAGVSKELGRSMPQVAINWIAQRPGVAAVILGVTKISQLDDNLQALDFTLPEELSKKLTQASRNPGQFPYTFFSAEALRRQSGGTTVTHKPPQYWGSN
jgi:aryl-alcohol dehydrogenase-like predicted oxidoreductase